MTTRLRSREASPPCSWILFKVAALSTASDALLVVSRGGWILASLDPPGLPGEPAGRCPRGARPPGPRPGRPPRRASPRRLHPFPAPLHPFRAFRGF